MIPTKLRSTRHALTSAILAIGLSGCAAFVTPGNPADLAEPVRLATTANPGELRVRAEQNDARAQQALALVLAYDLNGGGFDPTASTAWRVRSMGARGTRPITQYTAAFNGQPSRVNLIYIPRQDITAQHDQFIARCAAGLEAGDPAPVCGDASTTEALRDLWARAQRGR